MTCTVIPAGTETAEQYHRSGAWGSSLISTFLRSPDLAHRMITGKYRQPETAAMAVGTRFHSLLDPGSHFADRHRCGPDADRRTKIWQAAQTEAAEAGIDLIPHDEWHALHAMAANVRANPIALSLITGAEHEVGFRMASPYGNFRVQCRADLLHRWSHLADLKTTADIDEFGKSVANFGYHRQASFYRWVVSHACGGELLPFSFVVVEKVAPLYRCRVIDLDDDYLAIGMREVEDALIDIGRRTAANDWLDHHDADVVRAPTWLTKRSESEAA